MRERYKAQPVCTPAGVIDNFRITDTDTDSRVATCYLQEHADLVCLALNVLELAKPAAGEATAGFPFWLVACTETEPGHRARVELLKRPPRYCHDAEKEAEGEAFRLANAYRGFEFAVMKAVAVAKWDEGAGRIKWDEET